MQLHYFYRCKLYFLVDKFMAMNLEFESTLTDRYQTTVPETVRRALHLSKRDKLHYSIRSNGEVILSRAAAQEGADPVLDHFLNFLTKDMINHPERLLFLDVSLQQRIQALVQNVELDLNAPLSEDDE
jgi:antitoxin PrlF